MAEAACLVAKKKKVMRLGVNNAFAENDRPEVHVPSGPVVVTSKSQLGHFEKKMGHTQRTSGNRASGQRETGGPLADTGAVGGVRAVRAGRAFHQAPTFCVRTSSSPAPGWGRTSVWFYECPHLPKGLAGCVSAQRHETSQRHFRAPRNPTGP